MLKYVAMNYEIRTRIKLNGTSRWSCINIKNLLSSWVYYIPPIMLVNV